MVDPDRLFERYLDLAPLKDRRAGRVRCPFHADGTPSLSLDLDQRIWHCFGCGLQGGIREFSAALLRHGVAQAHQLAQRQAWAKPEVQALNEVQERIKAAHRDVAKLREGAPDTPAGWARLEAAARLETLTRAAESEVDEMTP